MQVQYKVFVGMLQEIEAEFNKWAASLVTGAQMNIGAATRVHPEIVGDSQFFKEVFYQLPLRSNGQIAVPQTAVPRGVRRGEPS